MLVVGLIADSSVWLPLFGWCVNCGFGCGASLDVGLCRAVTCVRSFAVWYVFDVFDCWLWVVNSVDFFGSLIVLVFVLLFGLGVSALGLLLFGFCVWGYARGGLGFFDLLFDLVCFFGFCGF